LVTKSILEHQYATQEELNGIDDRINQVVEESVRFAEESPWPDDSEVLKDVYIQEDYPFIVD
jgi:pyruvate dehydrogenase E1 component alpha subunit